MTVVDSAFGDRTENDFALASLSKDKGGGRLSEEQGKTCAHPACDCPPEAGTKYCSEYCKEAEKSHVIEIGCGCEHARCFDYGLRNPPVVFPRE